MTPTLIILLLAAVAVAAVVWAIRRKPAPPPASGLDQDTAWNDPVHRADDPAIDKDARP